MIDLFKVLIQIQVKCFLSLFRIIRCYLLNDWQKFSGMILVILLLSSFSGFAYANEKNSVNYKVVIPKVLKVEAMGFSPLSQTHGTPLYERNSFDFLVKESEDEAFWELTTKEPVGISISYNTSGVIMADIITMQNINTGYIVPNSEIRIYPDRVNFDVSPKTNAGDYQRIFHFNPIIKVSKKTPPGAYYCNINFLILGK